MADALVTQLARALNLSPDAARHTLNHLVAALREQIDATGEAAVPGLGTFRHDDDELAFHPEETLASAVNHRYAGLRAISAGSRRPKPFAPTPEPDDPFAAASPSATAPEAKNEAPPATEFQPLEAFIDTDEPEPIEEVEIVGLVTGEGDAIDDPAMDVEQDEEIDDLAAGQTVVDEPNDKESDDDEPNDESAALEAPDSEFVIPEFDAELDTVAEAPIVENEPTFGPESIEEDEPVAETEEPLVEAEETLSQQDDIVAEELTATIFAASAFTDEEDDEASLDPVPDDAHDESADDAVVEQDDLEEPDDTLAPGPSDIEDEEVEAIAQDSDGTDQNGDEHEDDRAWLEDVAATSAKPFDDTTPSSTLPPSTAPAAPVLAPAVMATAAPAATPDAPPRRSNRRALGGIAVLLLLALVALLWFLAREPDEPTIAEQQPVPEDTVAALPPPVDTMAVVPADTARVAVATPEPPPPAPDPLRSTAGIDRAAGGFSWIVGSEFSRAPADQRVAALREQGFRADVIAEEANGRTRYRVALGQFASIDEAERYRSNLPAGAPSDTWLLRL